MNGFICERPQAFFLLFLLIPALLVVLIKLNLYHFEDKFNHKSQYRLFGFKKLVITRTVFRCFGWIMLVLAFARISWGTYLAPVQKNGTAISFVFDISNSMNAKDGPEGKSRLDASKDYAIRLLHKIRESGGGQVSVVIAKGDGILAVPLTEDFGMVESLLEILSPAMMTAPGSSLGKGILCAKNSFPSNFSSAGKIWLFTDGEETDGNLKNALSECTRSGIPVSIIGFGSETGTVTLSGDNKTQITTALRESKIKETIAESQKNLEFFKNQTPVIYVNSTQRASAMRLLSQVNSSSTQTITYEAKPVPRYKMFLVAGILCFALSFIFTEFDFRRFKGNHSNSKNQKKTLGMLVAVMTLFTSCSSDTMEIVSGNASFMQQKFRHAVSCYLKVAERAKESGNNVSLNYALYNLGTAYYMLGEDQAALDRYTQIKEDAPDSVKYYAYYNAGIIAHKNNQFQQAFDFFKKALEVDSTSIEAKINMELSLQQTEVNVQQAQSQTIPASEEKIPAPDMEKAVFERIKENDQNQWKNSEVPQNKDLADDF